MATALLGNPVGSASRWIKAGPMFVQTSLLFLPLAVVLFARVSNAWTTLSILLIAIAVAVQPDRAMSGALFSALAALTLVKRTPAIFCALAASGVSFMATLLQADRLLAVPYVDHILWSSFDIHPLMGAALWLGCALLILPSCLLRSSPLLPEGIAFAACWAAIIGAAAMGAYPTPVVGYGASAIIGYFICLTAFRNRAYGRELDEVPPVQNLHVIKHDPFELRLAPLI